MPKELPKSKCLLRWDQSLALEVDRDLVVTPHRLCEQELSDRQHLVQTIEHHPFDAMSVFTMGTNPAHSNEWQTGRLSKFTGARDFFFVGAQLIEAVAKERLIVVLHDVAKHHSQYKHITKQLFQELTTCHVGLRIYEPAADLVLASPTAMQYFRCEHRPTIRWQLIGQQTVRTYPVTDNFVNPQDAENLIVDQSGHTLYFQPEFDDHATESNLVAGQMLSMPFTTPYRVEMGDGLNVWLQTQHDTPTSYRYRNISVANRILRKVFPESFCKPEFSGTWGTIKSACTRALGLANLYGKGKEPNESTFVVKATIESCSEQTAAPSKATPSKATQLYTAPSNDALSKTGTSNSIPIVTPAMRFVSVPATSAFHEN